VAKGPINNDNGSDDDDDDDDNNNNGALTFQNFLSLGGTWARGRLITYRSPPTEKWPSLAKMVNM
jgi:hypothetical protein